MQDRDLSEYNPALSNTSKHLSCSHQLCAWSTTCKSPDEPCTYKRDYYTDNTSTSGFMIEDKLHLASFSKHATQSLLQASVVLGCALNASHTLMFFSSLTMLSLRYWNVTWIFASDLPLSLDTAVVGNRVVAIWMGLPLMVLWGWVLETFQCQPYWQKQD